MIYPCPPDFSIYIYDISDILIYYNIYIYIQYALFATSMLPQI